MRAAGYRILLTGHSLGAGTASLIAIMLQHEGVQCECVAYATPPVVATDAAHQYNDLITSVVMRDDIVPRATPKNIRDLVIKIHNLPWEDMAEEENDWVEVTHA